MAQWKSLGLIQVLNAGTTVRATVNISNTAAFGQNQTVYFCMAVLFQAVPTNTGKMYIMDSGGFNYQSTSGHLAVLGVPTNNVIPSAGVNVPNAPNGLNAGDYFIDSDTNGGSVYVSVLVS